MVLLQSSSARGKISTWYTVSRALSIIAANDRVQGPLQRANTALSSCRITYGAQGCSRTILKLCKPLIFPTLRQVKTHT